MSFKATGEGSRSPASEINLESRVNSFNSQNSEGKQLGKFKKGREKPMANRKLMKERQKARDMHREALYSTRDTITLVAILIATFTYTAGISPPGGVHQDGHLIGTAVAARKTAFRVFSVCNNLALFTSICVVLVLVSIIPFKRKALMGMLAIAHKAIWVAVSFMGTAYVAAAVVIMHPPPRQRAMDWTTVFLLSICAGSLGTVFVGLGIMLIKHRLMKRKWRRLNKRRENRQEDQGNKTVEEHIQQEKNKTLEEHIQQEKNKTLEEHIQQEKEKAKEKTLEEHIQQEKEKTRELPVPRFGEWDSCSTVSDLDSSRSLGYYSH